MRMRLLLQGLRLATFIAITCVTAFAQYPSSYALTLGTSGDERVRDFCIDSNGSYVTAFTFQGTITLPGGNNLSQTLGSNGLQDNGIARYDFLGSLQWAASWGNQSGADRPVAVACDRNGFVYITGVFEGTINANPRFGNAANLTSKGATDVYVIKLTNSGNFVWARSLGGPLADAPTSISVDRDGEIVLTMTYRGNMDADPSDAGTRMVGSNGGQDILVVRLNPNGNFVWAASIGGTGDDGTGGAVAAMNQAGETIVVGTFSGTVDVDPTVAVTDFTSQGGNNAFIAVYGTTGQLVTARALLGTGDIRLSPSSLAIDPHDNYYVVGAFKQSIDIDTSVTVRMLNSQQGNYDVFAASYTRTHILRWGWRVGGLLDETVNSMRIDRNGTMVIGGSFRGSFSPNPVPNQTPALLGKGVSGATDGFAVKYRIADGSYVGSIALGNVVSGSSSQNAVVGAQIDTMGNVVVAGNFFGANLNFDQLGTSPTVRSSLGGSDMFLASYSWRHALRQPASEIGTPIVRATTNGASFLPGPVVRGELASLFGLNISTTLPGITKPDVARGLPIATKLCNTEVIFTHPNTSGQWKAPIAFCSDNQINYQVPKGIPDGYVLLKVVVDGKESNDLEVLVADDDVGIFMENAQNRVASMVFAVGQRAGQKAGPNNPLTACDAVEIYATGLGTVSPELPEDGTPTGQPPRGTPGHAKVLIYDDGTQGRNTPVAPRIVEWKREDGYILYTGLSPQYVGLYQINMLVPDPDRVEGGINSPVLLRQGNYPAQIEFRGRRSETFMINIRYSGLPSRCSN
jgi:uncharacterized protein (TIGR03437 family)